MGRLLQALRGPAGHPLHPPLTDATIGMFTLAAALAVIGALGWIEDAAGKGMWLALAGGLTAAVPTAVTGLAELLQLTPGTPPRRTATLHLAAMVAAVVLFTLAAWLQFDGYSDGRVTGAGLALTLAGFVAMTAGGWLGGTIVFVHGIRVMSQPRKPTRDAVSPVARPMPEEERPLRRLPHARR